MEYKNLFASLELSQEQLDAIKEHMSEAVKSFIREEFFFEVRKQMKSVIKEALYDPLDEKFMSLFRRIDRSVNKTLEKIDKNTNETVLELKKILETNQNVEEYIANMLLAIKQKDYLQAWYPAQKGFPEMNVIGKHPSKKNDKLAP